MAYCPEDGTRVIPVACTSVRVTTVPFVDRTGLIMVGVPMSLSLVPRARFIWNGTSVGRSWLIPST